MPGWFTVKVSWDIQSLNNSVSQKLSFMSTRQAVREIFTLDTKVYCFQIQNCTQIDCLPSKLESISVTITKAAIMR